MGRKETKVHSGARKAAYGGTGTYAGKLGGDKKDREIDILEDLPVNGQARELES